MERVFLVCAAAGGTFLVCQILAGLIGFGGDHDTDTDSDSDSDGSWFLGMLTVRAVTAAFLFFGIGGMIALQYEAEELSAFGIAVGSGLVALYLVALLMKSLAGLKSDGTARVDRAVGRTGTVYLRIPGGKAGPGKVQLMLQNRTVEYQAVTAGGELPTGTPIKVVAVVNADTVEVEAA